MADLGRLKGKGFLVIGRAGLDLYADPPGTPVERGADFTPPGGFLAKSLRVFADRMRRGTCNLSTDDAVRRFCINELDRIGIDRRFVRAWAAARNSLSRCALRRERSHSR